MQSRRSRVVRYAIVGLGHMAQVAVLPAGLTARTAPTRRYRDCARRYEPGVTPYHFLNARMNAVGSE